ncbi:hypothetical protein SSX86_023802 [Deinandra increscens subsp. villosa]|uniref:beta-galactosidase n=1 Tax=Deinandra increscens subsp. villosa TaxID=3103831 RepID=A0AAP0CGW6_9ASTR
MDFTNEAGLRMKNPDDVFSVNLSIGAFIDEFTSTMASTFMLLLDELWATLEKNQQRLVELNTRLGLPPPPPLAARPPLIPLPSSPAPPPCHVSPPTMPTPPPPPPTPTPAPPSSLLEPPPSSSQPPQPLVPHPLPKPMSSLATHPTKLTPFVPTRPIMMKTFGDRSPTSHFVIEPNTTGRREWRPPWRCPWRHINTAPNAVVRQEWRPPWPTHPVLEDKNVFKPWGMIRTRGYDPTQKARRLIQPQAIPTGFPVWLQYVPGFPAAIQGFTQKIVEMMKAENLFESQGGPIILSQIENEYGAQGKSLGPPGKHT